MSKEQNSSSDINQENTEFLSDVNAVVMRPLSELDEETMFVGAVDLDCEEPYCDVYLNDHSIDDKPMKFKIPKPLAYYQRTHFCGSEEAYENMLEMGRREVRNKIKDALNIK